jgi:hypothetical protein
VTREPEWDDDERAKLLALAQYESEICDCGFHTTVADSDPALAMKVRVCPVCAGLAQNFRVIRAQDDAAEKQLGQNPPPERERPEDGRHIQLIPKTREDGG